MNISVSKKVEYKKTATKKFKFGFVVIQKPSIKRIYYTYNKKKSHATEKANEIKTSINSHTHLQIKKITVIAK